jgi:hypothetical protein
MHGHAVAVCVLLSFSGLLRVLQDRGRTLVYRARARRGVRDRPPSGASPDSRAGSLPRLNAIELSLIADLNLEMAQDHEALAQDMTQRPETRTHAAETAAAWRERARRFRGEARRLGAHPINPGDPRTLPAPTYTGPERRRQMRRRQTRRAGAVVAAMRFGRFDRRAGADRRRRDRRGSEPAPSRLPAS